jgi:putative holliday junction resolvase
MPRWRQGAGSSKSVCRPSLQPGTSPAGRLLGLDIGERRVGVAISDPEQRLAVPLHSLVRDGRGSELAALMELARREEVAGLVVGLPLSLSGDPGAQAQSTRAFAGRLEAELGLEVQFWDERLSTQEALRLTLPAEGTRGRRRSGKAPAADTDALAAAIILQAYLDSRRQDRPVPD